MSILPQLLLNALITGGIYALVTSGLSLTFALTRVLNLAHGHLMMAGAYSFYYAYVQRGWGLFPATLFCMGSSVVLGLVTLKTFVAPFARYSVVLALVSTLAFATIIESTVSLIFDVNVKSLMVGAYPESFEWCGVFITSLQLLIIGLAIVILGILAFIVHGTGFGRFIRAFSESSVTTESLGISKSKVMGIVFIVSAMLSSLAGVLVGFETSLQPTMGNAYTLKCCAIIILGGLGNLWGTLVGAFLLGLMENLLVGLEFGSFSIPTGYKDAVAFVLILFVLLVRPEGLFRKRGRAAC